MQSRPGSRSRRRRRREVEKDLAAVQSRLSKFKNQLMEVKTNKEYQAMQKEMSVAEQEISDFETRMLERMEEADGAGHRAEDRTGRADGRTGGDLP